MSKEASRAYGLRKKLREGGQISDDEHVWLDGYTARTKGGKKPAPVPGKDRPAPRPDPIVETTPQPQQIAQTPVVPTESQEIPIRQWGAPESPPNHPEASQAPSPNRCTIKDCPACARELSGDGGVQICAATGKKVYPAMTTAGSEVIARSLLATTGLLIRMYRPDRTLVPPNQTEVKNTGEALRSVAYRRASWIGAYDDIAALVGSMGMYSGRALTHKTKEQLASGSPEKKS